MSTPRNTGPRTAGSYYTDPKSGRPPFTGCLRIGGAVVWSCWHEHPTSPEARACAADYVKNVDPEAGR